MNPGFDGRRRVTRYHAVEGEVAYLVDANGLVAVDNSSPSSPVVIDTYDFTFPGRGGG